MKTKMSLTVHSDKDRKPRYYVTWTGQADVLFESGDASETIQWAIDRHYKIIMGERFSYQWKGENQK